jgi:hypothetical protein
MPKLLIHGFVIGGVWFFLSIVLSISMDSAVKEGRVSSQDNYICSAVFGG